jgi:hypothetical protein
MSFISNVLKSRFAKKYAGLIGFGTIVLLITNPELLSFMLLINVIGIDIFILLVGIQLRQNWSIISIFIINPIYFKFKYFFTKPQTPSAVALPDKSTGQQQESTSKNPVS